MGKIEGGIWWECNDDVLEKCINWKYQCSMALLHICVCSMRVPAVVGQRLRTDTNVDVGILASNRTTPQLNYE